MTLCTSCKNNDVCIVTNMDAIRGDCIYYTPKNNGDRLRAMSNEELAEAFAQHMVDLACRIASNLNNDIGAEKQFLLEQNKADWLDWLQSPAEGGDGDGL